MTDEQVGRYIRLLCLQHQQGHLSDNHMVMICKTYDEVIWSKFIKDEQGRYYNERLDDEVQKRLKYSDSRRLNGVKGGRPIKAHDNHMDSICKAYGKPTDNHTEDVNENINDTVITTKEKGSRGKPSKQKTNTNALSTLSPSLQEAMTEFIEFRKTLKKPMTARAVELALIDLRKLSQDEAMQVDIVNQSIARGWTGFYELSHREEKQTKAGRWDKYDTA